MNSDVATLLPGKLLRTAEDLEARAPLMTVGQTLFEPTAEQHRQQSAVRRFVSRYSKTYSLAGMLSRQLSGRAQPKVLSRDFQRTWQSLTPKQRALTSAYDDDGWRTILTSTYRRQVVDDRDPRIEAGLAVVRASVARIAERCRQAGARLVTVFIPTKEDVFAGRVRHLEEYPMLEPLVTDEERLKHIVMGDLDRLGLEYVDLLGALRGADAQPYFEDLDGHPNAVGHKAIAAALGQVLAADGEFAR
jgi:hypothetical protein